MQCMIDSFYVTWNQSFFWTPGKAVISVGIKDCIHAGWCFRIHYLVWTLQVGRQYYHEIGPEIKIFLEFSCRYTCGLSHSSFQWLLNKLHAKFVQPFSLGLCVIILSRTKYNTVLYRTCWSKVACCKGCSWLCEKPWTPLNVVLSCCFDELSIQVRTEFFGKASVCRTCAAVCTGETCGKMGGGGGGGVLVEVLWGIGSNLCAFGCTGDWLCIVAGERWVNMMGERVVITGETATAAEPLWQTAITGVTGGEISCKLPDGETILKTLFKKKFIFTQEILKSTKCNSQ
jgi:hypothetical protein